MKKIKIIPKERSSGVLLHITSLPGKYGIGTIGNEAYKFIDFLKSSGQKYWQILPIVPTGFGDSPYQCFSAFAGNPLLIDIDKLINDNFLTKDFINEYLEVNNNKIDFSKLIDYKMPLFKLAFFNFLENSTLEQEVDFHAFCITNSEWLDDYSLFMTLKEINNQTAWYAWEDGIKYRKKNIIEKLYDYYEEKILFHKYIQYVFFSQWKDLKKYAEDNDIKIIGDIPLYVSYDSADVWTNPKLFDLDKLQNPINIAGVPPDYFNENGQLWGCPTYNWNNLKKTNFKWWINRFKFNNNLFDIVRFDHFIGLINYWAVPFNEITAKNGKWINAPGELLLEEIANKMPDLILIADNLGVISENVEKLRLKYNFPGMKVLQFGFNSDSQNEHLPHNYSDNYVVYTGTHDNDTSISWYNNTDVKEKELFNEYTGYEEKEINWKFIKLALSSVSKLSILSMQDIIGLDSNSRMNIPGTIIGNWAWKLEQNFDYNLYSSKLLNITKLYGRTN